MPVEEGLNKILKEMWRIDEKNSSGIAIGPEEEEFYKDHLADIKKYYQDNNAYWQNK